MSKLNYVVFRNCSDQSIKVCLEPWGEEYRLMPNQEAKVSGKGDLDHDSIDIHYHIGCIQIYGWQKDMILFIDGKKPDEDHE